MADVLVGPTSAGLAPERVVARDLARRGLWVAPLFVVVGAVFWRGDGALSAAFALVLVLGNFLIAAQLSTWAARVSLVALMSAVLIGYLVRLALIAGATFAVRGAGWFEPVPWGFTLIIAHLGLLAWEAKHVSASLAFPALKPKPPSRSGTGRRPLTVRSSKGS
jgi:hypothetical protein